MLVQEPMMGREKMCDFDVDSNDLCFICLKVVPPSLHSLHSLQYLSRYLGLDMDKVQRAKLKMKLCSNCASLNKTFSGLYRQLEKIQLQMVSCAELFYRKLLETEGHEWNMSSLNMNMSVEELRKETKLKCSQKLTAISPRVKVQKLSQKQLQLHMPASPDASSCESICSTDNLVDDTDIKWPLEDSYPVLNSLPDYNDDLDPLADLEHDWDPIVDDQGQSQNLIGVNIPEIPFGSEPSRHRRRCNKRQGQPNVKPVHPRATKYKIDCPYTIIRPPGQTYATLSTTWDSSTGRQKCNICLRLFKSYVSVKSHHRSVHGLARYQCKECGLQFPRGDICLRHHRSVHKPKTEGRYECHHCRKKFTRADHLTKHVKSTCCKKVTGNTISASSVNKPQMGMTTSKSPHSEIEISEVKLEPPEPHPVGSPTYEII